MLTQHARPSLWLMIMFIAGWGVRTPPDKTDPRAFPASF